MTGKPGASGGKDGSSDSIHYILLPTTHGLTMELKLCQMYRKKKLFSISPNSLYMIRLLKITNLKKRRNIKGSLQVLSEARTSRAFLDKSKNLTINHPVNFQFSSTK